MQSFRSTLHALPAVIVVALSLVVPLALAGGSDGKVGTAGSVTARAAQAGTTGGQDRFPVGSPELEAAKATAAAYWGAQPCGGTYALQWTPLDQGTNATASWRNPTDAWNNAGANFDCRIDLNPGADYDYAKLCTVLTHEVGHLLGRQHDPNPGQLMSAYYAAPIAQCMSPAEIAAVNAPAVDDSYDEDFAADDGGVAATDKPKKSLRKKTSKTTKTVKKCKTVKTRSGKRVKKCRTVRAKKATKAAARTSRR